jgi:hypothetical protein
VWDGHPCPIAFDVGFELDGITTAASTTVKERRFSAAMSVRHACGLFSP